MPGKTSNTALTLSLIFAVFLWGGNNTGTKFVVQTWPPIWTGGSRFLCAGLVLLALLRWTSWFGPASPLPREIKWRLWWQGGLSLAVYIVTFNWALRCTSASHVALYLAACPVWALLWEKWPTRSWATAQRYGAALLALGGVLVLSWPALKTAGASWIGELLGLGVSVLWTHYGRLCRAFGAHLSGVEITAHTMWRAGLLLLAASVFELRGTDITWRTDLLLIHVYCILAGAVAAFAIWNNALRHWPTSQVMLFNNLIPLSTMVWAHFCLGEVVTPEFWFAMLLIVAGVILGQANWKKLFVTTPALPPE